MLKTASAWDRGAANSRQLDDITVRVCSYLFVFANSRLADIEVGQAKILGIAMMLISEDSCETWDDVVDDGNWRRGGVWRWDRDLKCLHIQTPGGLEILSTFSSWNPTSEMVPCREGKDDWEISQ